MTAISPAVQVVTGGTNWPAIIAAISAGVVGLAGILATYWSGKRSINAENERARLAEKRRIYAKCAATYRRLESARISASDVEMYDAGAKEALENSLVALDDAVSELILIAPKNIRKIARQILEDQVAYVGEVLDQTDKDSGDSDGDQSTMPKATIGQLWVAMRADLGETDE
jgi:hypothetical protein